MQTCLIISTFNWPEALQACLASAIRQSVSADEILIVDDGSSSSTRALVSCYNKRYPEQTIKYCWQPDRGFRLSRSRNLGILKTTCENIIFVDGDCILPRWFIKNYRELITPGSVVAGGRRLLSDAVSAKVLNNGRPLKLLFFHYKFLNLRLSWIRNVLRLNWDDVRGCNFGLTKTDLLDIWGFDEAFQGWGREDSDCIIRLINAGGRVLSGRLSVCVNHLFHIENAVGSGGMNEDWFQRKVSDPHHTLPRKSMLEWL